MRVHRHETEEKLSATPSSSSAVESYLFIAETNKNGGETERHLPETDDHVVGSAGERRKDVEMKRENIE